MNIREQLLIAHNKINSLKIVNYIGKNQERFEELFSLFKQNEEKISQRAAYSVGHCIDEQPQLLQHNHLSTLVEYLSSSTSHDAVIRCTVRILQDINLPEDLQGKAIDGCYKLLRDYKQPVAIRAFSIAAIYRVTNDYPELKQELLLIVQDLLDHDSSGLRGRANKIYNKLKKEIDLP